MDLLCFCSVLCLLCLCVRLFICALWSTAGKGLTSWLSFVVNPDIRNAGTLDAFKLKLNQNLPVIPKHYYSGIRKYQIWHPRIRTGCSLLKNDLFLKNIIDSPLCTCNSGDIENAYHFFFIHQLYTHLRVELRQSITQYCNMTLDVLLRGDERLSTNINTTIFEAVHKYIQKSKRF